MAKSILINFKLNKLKKIRTILMEIIINNLLLSNKTNNKTNNNRIRYHFNMNNNSKMPKKILLQVSKIL